MSSETRRGSRSEDRSKEKRIKDSKRSNSASSENGTRSRSRNPCSKDKRNRSNRARKNKSSSQSIDGTSGSSPDCRKRSDRESGVRNRDYRNGLRAMHQENANRGGGGGGFRKRRPSPGQLNWSRDQYDKRRQMSSRGHFQGLPRFDRQERFRNNSFNRFRDRNWQNRQNFRFNDRNRDRFQDRNNDRARRNRTAQLNEEPPVTDTVGKNSREASLWVMESPERKRERPTQPKLEESAAPLSPHLLRSNRSNSPLKKKKINRSRSSSTSSSSSDTSTSSSSTSSSSSSSTSSSSSSSSERDKKRKKKKKLSKKAKKAEKKRREKKKKLKKKQKKKMMKAAKEKKLQVEKKSSKDRLIKDVSIELAEKSKSMAPMTKEEWDKRQNVIRRVFDEETGRHRLVKGDGEILEEIVTKERHKEINRQATRGDGEYFQSRLRTNK